ncbi:YceI family protein [Formosa sp. PL04]|uniref:YceI family protein n=1 Tax=Formosa sp. PL04 TaxID=3081755 RepID=UPI0029812E42|nr:YceI family protein [Formosa sp. PL04]MDW5288199.1 YceI family protein [Formosa sp. PL04]
MKKITILMAAFALTFATACKSDKKETVTPNDPIEETARFVIKPEGTTVNWTAYKTTAKTPVSGVFTTLDFEPHTGSSAQEALNGVKFSIPVSSIFSKDSLRDTKLQTFFFDVMADTKFLKGTLKTTSATEAIATITMNGETHDLPLTYTTTEDRRISLNGVMLLKDWNALDALATLHKACEVLHTGTDGVSKTWDEVAINIDTYLREN